MERPPRVLQPVVDKERKVQLDFTIKYAECDLADKRVESHPVVHMYYSNQYVRDIETGGVVYIHLNEDKLNTQYTGSIIATLDRKHDGIPPMSGIGICSYAVHRNDLGHACYVNVGTSHVFMGDILGEIQKQGYYDHNHELMMRTVVVAGLEPIKKGVLEFRINAVSLGKDLIVPGPYGNRGGGGEPKARMSTVASLLQEPISAISANLEGYIQSSGEAEMKIPDALPNVGRVRVPMDISEVGAEFSKGTFLPAAAYAMLETPQANAEFFRNSFEVVMARRNLTIADYHDFSEHDKTRTMARMISGAVQLFDYIGDAIELGTRDDRFFKRRHVGNEEFGKIWATLTGDCEDSSGGIASVLKAYIAVTDFNPTVDAHLIEMQKMAKHDYVPLQTLAVVHGQKIGDQEGFGAHMYLTLLPTHYVEEGLRKTYLGRQFLDQLEPAVVPVGSSSSSSSYFGGGDLSNDKNRNRSVLHEDRPVLICEGTGIIDPIGHPGSFPMIDQYRYVMSHMPSLRSGKCEIPRVQGEPSSFYYALMSTITDKYIDEGINIGAFVLGQENKQHNPMDPANAHEMSRGALFTDLIRGKDTLAISPQPPIPEPTMRLMEEANAFVCPPRPLVLDRKKPIAGAGNHAPWDKFVSTVASFGRPKGNKAAGSVKFYYRPHHYNDNFINKLISEAAQAPNVWAADYVVEHWTNGIYNIRLELYVH